MKRTTAEQHNHLASISLPDVSVAQREIWLAQRLNPDRSFSLGVYAEIDGDVRQDLLERAVAVVVDETPALRTRFEIAGDQLHQSLDASIKNLFTVTDLSHVEAPKSQALTWIREDLSRSRRPEERGLCAFVLIRLDDKHYLWYQRYHHIVIDGRSVALIAKRIGEIYSLLIDGQALSLSDACAPLSQSDSGTYQISSVFRADREFWKGYLERAFCPTWLSRTSRVNSGRQRSYSEVVAMYRETQKLLAVARQIAVSQTQIWVAVIAIHFHLLIGKTDLQFSLPVANCTRGEEDVPGMTANVLPLRLCVCGTDRLNEIAYQATKAMKRVLRHQRYRGADIRRDSHVKQDGWFGPAINLVNFGGGAPFPGCRFACHFPSLGPIDDFSIWIIDCGNGEGHQVILRDVATAHTGEELQAHAQRLMQILIAFLEQPDQTVEVLKERLSAQSNPILGTSFYANRRMLEEVGCLRWNVRAQSLSTLVRALVCADYYSMPLGLPKILIGDHIVCVSQLEVMTQRSGAASGSLLKVEEGQWQIATDSEDIVISQFSSLEGNVLNPQALALQLDLHEGDCLPLIKDEQVKVLTETYETLVPHECFWLQRLVRFRPLSLPYERSNTVASASWQASGWHIPMGLRTFAEGRRFEYVLTAWMIYLARITGETALQVGWMVSSYKSDISRTPGLFAPSVPMEIDVDGLLCISEAVSRVRNELTQLESHHAYLSDLMARCSLLTSFEALQSPRPWPVAVALVEDFGAEGTATHASNLFCGKDACGEVLTLQVCKYNGRFRWIYDAARLKVEELDRMAQHLQVLMEAIVDPGTADVAIDQLEILPPAERRLLLETWNATEAPYPKDLCIHQLFEEQVRKTPEATAVVYEDQCLSYAELNVKANCLAHHLISLGVKPDDRVAICVERSLAMVIGLLAILKAGGAYVPMDPVYPSGRLGQILADAAPTVVLSDAIGREALGAEALEDLTVLDLDPLRQVQVLPPVWADLSATDPNSKALGLTSDHLAYVIYTSGSTGTPKGVMVEHQSVVNFLYSMSAAPGITAQDRLLAVTSVSFDIAGLELYLPLSNGAQIVLANRNDSADPHALQRALSAHQINIMQATPATWRALLDAHWKRSPDLTILCGGEAMPADLSSRLRDQGQSLWNLYGPTETTIWSSCFRIPRPEVIAACSCPNSFDGAIVPIGRPIANTQIYILGANGQPVPVGASGELYIGGAGVARGYLNRPELTAERFVPDPFASEPGARMFRTGDLGRWRADGNIEFLGRNDFQVKIRGFRIELGEIEARLTEHSAVREAVVIAREDTSGEKRLVAYYTISPVGEAEKGALGAEELRSHLSATLPEYMVPAAYVRLDTLPLTPSGKLDRRALPAPDGGAYVITRGYEAPQGEIETALAAIWAELLKLDRVGRHDDFFALGGDSLQAVRAVTRLQERLNLEVTIDDLFTHPVLADLGRCLEGAMRGALECPANSVPVAVRQTDMEGTPNRQREEAHT